MVLYYGFFLIFFFKIIWHQCEDPHCKEIRSPITIGRNNFISDLRFRLLADTSFQAYGNSNHSELNEISAKNEDNIVNYMLEIRRFSKNDEACYECQLNKIKSKKIHYCLKLKRNQKKFLCSIQASS